MPIIFFLEKRVDKTGKAPIRVKISIKGAKFETTTGQKIDPTRWDKKKQQVKKYGSSSDNTSSSTVNAVLAKIRTCFTFYEGQCSLTGEAVTNATLRRVFAENFGKKTSHSVEIFPKVLVSEILDEFIHEEGDKRQWSANTKKKFITFQNHLAALNRHLTLSDINNENFYKEFVSYLIGCGLKNVSVNKDIKLLKWFLRWTEKKGYKVDPAYRNYANNLKTTKKKIVFLSWEELMRLFHYEVPANRTPVKLIDGNGNSYIKVVDNHSGFVKTLNIFCFCSFTGLRYSDAANLKWVDVNDQFITLTTIKTASTLTIQLNKYAKAILERCRQDPQVSGFVFPSISNQKMNDYLKDVCELCGINEPVTQTYYKGNKRIEETLPKYAIIGTHAGRRTFICNSLMLGIPPDIVMKWTGHSDYNAMKPYIDITEEAKATEMSKFDKI